MPFSPPLPLHKTTIPKLMTSGMEVTPMATSKLLDQVVNVCQTANVDMTISKTLPRKSGPKMVLLERTDSTKRNTGHMVATA